MPPEFAELLRDQVRDEEPLLRAYLRRRVRSADDVEDYIQDVYARVLATPPTTRVKNWQGLLRRVAANLVIDGARRAQVRGAGGHVNIDDLPEHRDEHPSAEQALMTRQRLDQVSEALKHAPPIARAVFLLVRVEGLSHRDAAERLGLDVKTASRHVERVLVLISQRLAETL